MLRQGTRVSLAEALLSNIGPSTYRQHIDGVARASSAGSKSGSSARSLVLHTMLSPVVENRSVEGPARARRRSELTNRRRRCHGLPLWHLRRRFANFQRQRGPADPRESVFRADGPFMLSEYGFTSHTSFTLQSRFRTERRTHITTHNGE